MNAQLTQVHMEMAVCGCGFKYLVTAKVICLQCFDTVGWALGRAPGL